MKVLHVVDTLALSAGGLSVFVAELVKTMQGLGVESWVTTSGNRNLGGAACVDRRSLCLPLGRPLTSFEAQRFQIIHIHGLWLPIHHRLLALSALSGHSVRCIATRHARERGPEGLTFS